MLSFANIIWGARCGKSARRVLLGETSSSDHAHSVRGARESVALRQAPHGLPSSRLVSTIPLDLWFERRFRRQCRGQAYYFRFADDFLACFQYRGDAERFLREMKARLEQFHLEIEPSKTKLISFGRFAEQEAKRRGKKPETFEFLGFTHYCGKSRNENFKVKRRTSSKKFRAKLKEVKAWLRGQHS